ncbi:MAG: flagellar protein export ATPase FliI [Terriglobia bacterium]
MSLPEPISGITAPKSSFEGERTIDFRRYHNRLEKIDPITMVGTINKVVGLVIESQGPPVRIGDLCDVLGESPSDVSTVEVVGFKAKTVLSMPLGKLQGVRLGNKIVARNRPASVRVGPNLLGRILDGLGNPIDHLGPIHSEQEYPLHKEPENPLSRENIAEPLSTGVRAVDAVLTCGKGQRVGIFGGSGVGKSTLLGMMAKYTSADVNVISLVGERGRELRSFIEKDLGEEGLRRSVVVVSTSDNPPLVRIRAALTATAIAEYFMDQGKNVLLVMDSVTRFAMAQREVGLAAGEPPASKGYTPSVFAMLPKLLERAGNFHNRGSITGFYTILVEGDDMNDPIADSVRAILDGHIVLNRELAARNHYPCIDLLDSVSRLFSELVSPEHRAVAGKLRELLATYKKAEDLINIGAYVKGNNPLIDRSIEKIDAINTFLRQKFDERVTYQAALGALTDLFS